MIAQIFNIALTTFYVCWLIAVLVFLYVIWRTGARSLQRLEDVLSDSMLTTAQSARRAAEAAYLLAQQGQRESTPETAQKDTTDHDLTS